MTRISFAGGSALAALRAEDEAGEYQPLITWANGLLAQAALAEAALERALEDMPDVDTEPGCEWGSTDPSHQECGNAATIRIYVHRCPSASWQRTYLLCQSHVDRFVDSWSHITRSAPVVCAFCSTPFRQVSDVIERTEAL